MHEPRRYFKSVTQSSRYVKLILPTSDAFDEFDAVNVFLGTVPDLTAKSIIEAAIAQHIAQQASDGMIPEILPYEAVLAAAVNLVVNADEFVQMEAEEQNHMVTVIERIAMVAYLHVTELLDRLRVTPYQQEMMSLVGWYGYNLAVEIPDM